MRAAISSRALRTVALAALVLAAAAPAGADLRVGDLDVLLAGRALTVSVALRDAIGPATQEGLQSGIPAHVRVTVEVWQHHRYWRDTLLLSHTVERTLTFNVLTKEYRVTAVRGESRSPHVTRDLRDAQRVLSEVRGLRLDPPASGDPVEVLYVRVRATAALNGDHSLVTRLAGTAEQAVRQSDHQTLLRMP